MSDVQMAKRLRELADQHPDLPLIAVAERIELLERELLSAAEMLATSGVLINAIKAYRAVTRASLVDSKAAMERFKPVAQSPSRIDALERRVEKLEARV